MLVLKMHKRCVRNLNSNKRSFTTQHYVRGYFWSPSNYYGSAVLRILRNGLPLSLCLRPERKKKTIRGFKFLNLVHATLKNPRLEVRSVLAVDKFGSTHLRRPRAQYATVRRFSVILSPFQLVLGNPFPLSKNSIL